MNNAKFYNYDDLKIRKKLAVGMNAVAYDIGNNLIYKEFFRAIKKEDLFYSGITMYEHFNNLSNYNMQQIYLPKAMVLKGNQIKGVIEKENEDKLLSKANLKLVDLLKYDEPLRKEIIELSLNFELFDLNASFLYFSKEKGLTLLNVENFVDAKEPYTKKALYDYYWAILASLKYDSFYTNYLNYLMQGNLDYFCLENIVNLLDRHQKIYQEVGYHEDTLKRVLKG